MTETNETEAPLELTDLERLEINLEYATRLIWLIVNQIGGEVEITKEEIETATFRAVEVSDTVSGGLHIKAATDD